MNIGFYFSTLLQEVHRVLEEVGKVEQMPKLEGKRMYMMVAPKPGGGGGKK